MKKILVMMVLGLVCMGVGAEKYVDLGLPSGTLWKSTNEQGSLLTYEEAERLYGEKLPTREQLAELAGFCEIKVEKGFFRFTGPNGNYILMPAFGYREWRGIIYSVGESGSYWSRTPSHNDNEYYYLSIYSSGDWYVGGTSEPEISGHSVRLVITPATTPEYEL